MELKVFLERLMELFERSAMAYHEYLDAGKTFQFARQLKLHNTEALKLLEENKSSLPATLQPDAQALIIHYKEWSMNWEKLAAEKNYAPDEVFVFTNYSTFPKQAAQYLERYYRELISNR